MTYCVGLNLKDGLVLLSDTRTNAGVDNISVFSKMHVYEVPGERVITLLTAGNLAISQAVINLLNEGVEIDGVPWTLLNVPSMFRAAQIVGEAVRGVYRVDGDAMEAQSVKFDVSLLLGGQLKDREMRLFQVYAAGNFIEATPDTPFFQIGEHKYGKPILDRAVTYDTDPHDGVKLVLISMDSTLRSNLSVGLPVDLLVYRRDRLAVDMRQRITDDDEYFRMIRERWSEALREAYRMIPRPPWAGQAPARSPAIDPSQFPAPDKVHSKANVHDRGSAAMRLTSGAFADGKPIPERHTCDGANLSPPLQWDAVPAATRSLVLLCDDPDAPAGTWHHWAIYDIAADRRSLPEDAAGRGDAGLHQAVNDFRKPGYGGPCPPSGHGLHRYHFRLLALDVTALGVRRGASCREVEQAARQHLIAEATLIGVYQR